MTLDRWLAKVAIGDPDDCWPWLGFINPGGYGRFHVAGRNVLAHRWIVQHLRGPLKRDDVVMHTCDNPACVNPMHLRVGTHADNVADKIAKGRARWGSANAAKTHCKYGHPFDEANTIRVRGNQRHCRACHNRRNAERYQR